MSEPNPKPTPKDPAIVRHIAAISSAGQDLTKYVQAIEAVRDDPRLPRAKREAIWMTLAQEAAQAYYVFTTGQPLDMDALIESYEASESA